MGSSPVDQGSDPIFDASPDAAAWLMRPIATANVFEETVGRLAQAIKLGIVSPGSRFPSERGLSEAMQVSRTTLREAIRTLEYVGYVETRRGRSGGTFVTDRAARASTSPSSVKKLAREMGDDLRNALDLRWALEPAAASLAARRRTDQDLTELGARLRHSIEVPSHNFRFADLSFHLSIANVSKSEAIVRAVSDVQMKLGELLTALPVLDRSISHSHEQHRAILVAIKRNDEYAARVAMEEHIAATAELLLGLTD